MRIAKLVVSICLFVTISYLGFDLITNSRKLQTTKSQYAELNHFSHGLFSVNEWKSQLGEIVSDEINSLTLRGETGAMLRGHLEKQLGIFIDRVAIRIKRENWKSTEGWFKQKLMESFVDLRTIKAGIPEYADAMMKELTSPRTERQIKGLLRKKVDRYIAETFDKKDDSLRHALVVKFGDGNEENALANLDKTLTRGKDRTEEKSWIMIALSVALFVLLGFSRKPLHPPEYFLLSLTLLVLLLVGINIPMIDMEAKISELSFVLLDHEVRFKDQVLFFQSKSILDVFHVMITHKQLQMNLVAILLVTFSVIFPMFKLLASLAYYYDYCAARTKKFVKFFVLRAGKWSMADVLVVAIFMSYIGMNGIINSQLKNIREYGESLNVVTTNGTELQPGFYVFLAYTILALFLSQFLTARECGFKKVAPTG